jgi:hypothetical protein
VIKIIFVKSLENKADIFTKNVNGEIYKEHIENFIIHCQVLKNKQRIKCDSRFWF